MESSDSLPFHSLKSKKILHSSSQKPPPSDETRASSDRSPWSSITPEKPVVPPRRGRNCRSVISVKEVREVAAKLQVSGQDRRHQDIPVGSDEQQIGPVSGDALMAKPKKNVDESIQLPEKYEILGKFFNCLDSSIRLLRLKGSASTFTNISPKVEYLTDRRFSYGHLAQLKFIFPEVFEIKRVLVHDERTSCMKPDLHVTMNADAIKNEEKLKSTTGNSNMRKVFRCRLLDFFIAHPEGEVPKGTLPEPFNQSKLDHHKSTTKKPSSSSLLDESFTVVQAEQQPAAPTHLPQSFQKRFSRQNPAAPTHLPQSFQKRFSRQNPHPTPLKERDSTKIEISSPVATSTPVELLGATPALQPPKRRNMSPDDKSTSSPNKLATRPVAIRSLKFGSPVKNAKVGHEVNSIGGLSVENDIFQILPKSLLQSIGEKERKALEENDPAISQAKRRQQMIASLPKLFDMIRYLFQSIRRSVLTKEEFMNKIMASHLDIVDKREVEEQLKLLQELVPEWIYEKSASSGDLLICVNKISCPESVRARLVEEK
ncbi:hypothetical protein U1Q18_045719 [Sarracenia purpurea var. burkii]